MEPLMPGRADMGWNRKVDFREMVHRLAFFGSTRVRGASLGEGFSPPADGCIGGFGVSFDVFFPDDSRRGVDADLGVSGREAIGPRL